MVKNTESSESSDDEQSYSSSSEEWSKSSDDADEIVEVNGFQVLDSKVNQVMTIFEKHPDMASDFSLKNQQLRNAYMGVLLNLVMTLCQNPKELTMDDVNKADRTVLDLTKAGFKLHWLRQKLDEAFQKKEKKREIRVRIRLLDEKVKKRKLSLSDLESDLKKQKDAALATEASFDFCDIV
ncbi:MATH domain and coiled-coil domain-containing protein At3g58280-like [Raphanus sativus]|uniref:MATH domain and coiled-coil domain-containing protein At3g58280-like n=1 Tax=Raphanus sativus TaxID=3726 RepID=A0A6J0NKA0_RAPSA|nr:MATH domain and coiled-coil domain-containing protein At3g58280-like [Raphanus sativus]